MRLPRDGRVSRPPCQLLSPVRRPGSRKRHQARRSRSNPRRCLHPGRVLPSARLRLKKWRLAHPALRQRSLRPKGRKERLRLLLKRSLPQRRPFGRRWKLRLLLRKRSLPRTKLCRQKAKLRLPLLHKRSPPRAHPCRRKWNLRLLPLRKRSPPKIQRRRPRRLKQSQRHSRRLLNQLRLPRRPPRPFSTSSLLSSAKMGRRCRRLTWSKPKEV
jgi:hypothetical protein